MSFYRIILAGVAALGLATTALAADEVTTNATTTETTTETTTTTEVKPINLNTATAKELVKVEGLNSAKAKSIVSYRNKHGEFKSLDELKEVKGFKKMDEETLKKIENQLTLS